MFRYQETISLVSVIKFHRCNLALQQLLSDSQTIALIALITIALIALIVNHTLTQDTGNLMQYYRQVCVVDH